MDQVSRQKAPGWARSLKALNTYLTEELLGGRKVVKLAWPINLHKFSTVFVVAALMLAYDNRSRAAWVYLALHGTYGICWLLKHVAFPDPGWEVKGTIAGGAVVFGMLLTYWVAPFLLISDVLGENEPARSIWLLALCVSLHTFGIAVMLVSDAQKYFTLKARKGLITGGMFKYLRHPNYMGEMLVYGSYALLVGHWIPWAILAFWWLTIFVPNMHMIASSLSRYPEWDAYKKRTGMVLPRLFTGGK